MLFHLSVSDWHLVDFCIKILYRYIYIAKLEQIEIDALVFCFYWRLNEFLFLNHRCNITANNDVHQKKGNNLPKSKN
jgi:hypothetical protein